MKKSLALSLFLICLFLTSCKKNEVDDNNTSAAYIKGTINGISYNYSTNAAAKINDHSSTGEPNSVNIIAGDDNSPEGFNLSIIFFNGSLLQTGIYSEDARGVDYSVAGVYHTSVNDIVHVAGNQSPSVNPLVIKILTKTDTEITGTFQGAFYKEDIASGIFYPEYILANGSFKLPLQ